VFYRGSVSELYIYEYIYIYVYVFVCLLTCEYVSARRIFALLCFLFYLFLHENRRANFPCTRTQAPALTTLNAMRQTAMHESELCCHLFWTFLLLGKLLLGGWVTISSRSAVANRQLFPPIYLSYMFSSSGTMPGTDYILPQIYTCCNAQLLGCLSLWRYPSTVDV
jgi:hypothetical protein